MFVIINTTTQKLGSHFPTLEEAQKRLASLGSLLVNYAIIDVGNTPYEKVNAGDFEPITGNQ